MEYIFGADIGGMSVKCGLFEYDGSTAPELIDKWSIPTDTSDGGSRILSDIAQSIHGEIERIGISPESVLGCGIGVPGAVSGENFVKGCPNLGWGAFDVAEEFRKLSGIENVKVANDANAAALGEYGYMIQSGRDISSLALITVGTGIGCGIIIDGKIVSGANGAGGEIGHFKVSDTETRYCGCGKRGCLEQYASARGVVQTALDLLENPVESTLSLIPDFSAKDVFDAAREGDALAHKAVDMAARKLGLALSYVSCVVDPDVFLIGGGASRAGDVFLEQVRKYYKEACFYPSRETGIIPAELGNDAGIFGCAYLVI